MARTVKSSAELKSLPAYKLEYEEHVPDCNGQGMLFTHIKSGARVSVISNDDENKVFCISFRTTPTDDTGVAHITEHSVLCGSEKYPPKDPFMELEKSSLNTFLNAFTYPDKTCYPVASCNDADFANLSDVYMDAVFHPNTYKHEEIFRQEGWRYELNSKEEPITINGVVYSEMKGAFSSAEDRQYRELTHALFPDTTYGVESGGDPKAIPDLTYEQFLDFHRRYYHPTNSYIYIYGDMDVEERLEWLDREYLSKYDVQPVDSQVTLQKPMGVSEVHSFYPIGEDDPEENAGYLAWAFTLGHVNNLLENAAMGVLVDALFNVPGAPIKEALVKAGIGQDISCFLSDYIVQPFVAMIIRNTSVDKLGEMKKILKSELERLVREGVDKKSLLGIINGGEFRYCEADYGSEPKGLEYGVCALRTWLYDDSKAFAALHVRESFEPLRRMIDEDGYEKLIEKYMLNGDNVVFQTMAPKKGMTAESEKALEEKLAALKASMTDAELDEMIRKTAALKAYQEEPSTPEELATIPMLKREDIEKKSPKLIISRTDTDGIPTYLHDIDTNGIVYVKLLFDMDKLDIKDAKYAAFAAEFMGRMNTAKHSYLEFNSEVNIYTGGIGMRPMSFPLYYRDDCFRIVMGATGAVLEKNVDKLFELLAEGLLETEFADPVRIRELAGETKARMQYSLAARGNATAMNHALAGLSSDAVYDEQFTGLGMYRNICELLDMSDEELLKAAASMKRVLASTFGSDNMTIDITCGNDVYERIKDKVSAFAKKFGKVRTDSKKPSERLGEKQPLKAVSEGLKTAGEVNYLAIAGKSKRCSAEMSGAMAVTRHILGTEYLWNNVRVLGGAYGSGFSYDIAKGIGSFYSYRDPHLAQTLEVYKKTADFLRNFEADERTMTKFVIGTMGGVDRPLSPSAKGARALAVELSERDPEDLQKIRDAILSADVKDIRACAELLDEVLSKYCICAVGTEAKLNSHKEMFDTVSNLL
ncbi:MAG: insulinase family protein [Lachnospiraceae bacterium]|nr:insulinase family protein [Lachnospiraceae bacterium]